MRAGINKARAMTREEALKRAEKGRGKGDEGGPRQHRLIVEYDRKTGPMLRKVLENNYNQMVDRPEDESILPQCSQTNFQERKKHKGVVV